MLALTSCSTIGNMHNAPAATSTHKQQVIKHQRQVVKPHHPKKQVHKAPQIKHHIQQPVQVIQPKNKIAPVIPVVKAAVVTTVASQTPVASKIWILNTQSANMNHRIYKNTGRRREVSANLDQLDNLYGQNHYIQIIRWDGTNVSQAFVNTRTTKLALLLSPGLLDNGYIETGFGPIIMMLGGNGYIIEAPGHINELILIQAKAGPAARKMTMLETPDDQGLRAVMAYTHIDDAKNAVCSIDEAYPHNDTSVVLF